MSIKRAINLFLKRNLRFSFLYSFATKINLIIFHWNERCHFKRYGKCDADKNYYVIRSRGRTEGLLSSVLGAIGEIKWAKNNGFIPFVDFSDSTCQYHVDRLIHGTNNAWEYFFLQPENLSLDDIKKKKNVLLSGWTLFSKQKNVDISSERIQFRPYIWNIVNEYMNKEFIDNKVLGVFIRGTDYVALKPKGHSVQPSIEDVRSKIDEYMQKYDFDKIYVVTEDASYYKFLSTVYPNKVFSYGDAFVENYAGKDYISSAFNDDPYERGLNYLIRIILLSECKYTICSRASGSSFAQFIRKKAAIDEYWFELGVY